MSVKVLVGPGHILSSSVSRIQLDMFDIAKELSPTFQVSDECQEHPSVFIDTTC